MSAGPTESPSPAAHPHSKRWKIQRPLAHADGKTYQQLRDEIATGDLLLFRGNRLLSNAIERLSDSPYSHVAVLARWGDRVVAFQADLQGVQLLPASTMVCKYQGKVDWWSLKHDLRGPDGVQDRALLDTALTLLGIKYGYWNLLTLGLRIMLGRALNPTEAHATPDSLFCSQFVSLLFRTVSNDRLRVNPKANDACTSPADFAASGFFQPRCQLFDGSGGQACQDLFAFTPSVTPGRPPEVDVRVWDGRSRRR